MNSSCYMLTTPICYVMLLGPRTCVVCARLLFFGFFTITNSQLVKSVHELEVQKVTSLDLCHALLSCHNSSFFIFLYYSYHDTQSQNNSLDPETMQAHRLLTANPDWPLEVFWQTRVVYWMCKCCCLFGLLTEQNVIEPTSLASRCDPECKHITSRASWYLTWQLCKGMPLRKSSGGARRPVPLMNGSLSESQALKLKKMRVLTQTTIYDAHVFAVSGAGSCWMDHRHAWCCVPA